MKPPPFEYHRPATLGEALALLEQLPEAKPLAGGQSLIPAMNFRLAAPPALVDLGAVAGISGIAETRDGGLRIGAMTRHRAIELSAAVAGRAPLLAEAMPHIAHVQIRSRGTIGGSLAHADPAAELPAVMVALRATMVVSGARGERRVTAEEFFTGLFATALLPGELLTAVEIPGPAARSGSAFLELSRRHGDYALVGVAAVVELEAEGTVAAARIALFSVGEGPVLAHHAASALLGTRGDAAAVAAAAAGVQGDIDPPGDIHASPEYRRRLAEVLVGRAATRARDRAVQASR
ncbi:MAG TPA: xanthine dehydrogenase family protein subunit M [Gemmatimonadales bacterium]